MDQYKVDSVCFDPWAEKIRSYWRFLGGGECYVLLGETNGYVLLIPKLNPKTGKTVYGILVDSPRKISEFRNFLWHEMGHVVGEQSDDPVMKEFQADKWAIETSIKKGFNRVAEEILLRCTDSLSGTEDVVYMKAAKRLIAHFQEFAAQVVRKHQ